MNIELTEAELRRIFETRIIHDVFDGVEPSQREHPLAVMIGGQPGAGKTGAIFRLSKDLQAQSGEKAIVIDGDALRQYHPHFFEFNRIDDRKAGYWTGQAMRSWVKMCIEHAISNRYNVVLEGTFKNPEKVEAQASKFRDAGYQTRAEIVSTPYAVSKMSVQLRYEQERSRVGYGRLTPTESHDGSYHGIAGSIERLQDSKLVESVTISRRDGIPVHESHLSGTRWSNPNIKNDYEIDRMRTLTPLEGDMLRGEVARLHSLLGQAGRSPDVSDRTAATTHTRLCNELLVRSGLQPFLDAALQAEQEEEKLRIERLPKLRDMAGAALTFWKHADAAISRVGIEKVEWLQVERATIHESVNEHRQDINEVLDIIAMYSPRIVTEEMANEIRSLGDSTPATESEQRSCPEP